MLLHIKLLITYSFSIIFLTILRRFLNSKFFFYPTEAFFNKRKSTCINLSTLQCSNSIVNRILHWKESHLTVQTNPKSTIGKCHNMSSEACMSNEILNMRVKEQKDKRTMESTVRSITEIISDKRASKKNYSVNMSDWNRTFSTFIMIDLCLVGHFVYWLYETVKYIIYNSGEMFRKFICWNTGEVGATIPHLIYRILGKWF